MLFKLFEESQALNLQLSLYEKSEVLLSPNICNWNIEIEVSRNCQYHAHESSSKFSRISLRLNTQHHFTQITSTPGKLFNHPDSKINCIYLISRGYKCIDKCISSLQRQYCPKASNTPSPRFPAIHSEIGECLSRRPVPKSGCRPSSSSLIMLGECFFK